MECDKPECAVMCPKSQCPSHDCPFCKATCGDPVCKLKCPNKQPCHNVCEQPTCEWKCKAPTECPAPKCQMVCEHPKNCMGNTYQDMPPLQPGEIAVQSFTTPDALLQAAAGK